MNLFALHAEVGAALAPTGLRIYPHGGQTKTIEAPAAVVAMPDRLEPSSYGRGARTVHGLTVMVCVRDIAAGRPGRSVLGDLYAYCGETGNKGVSRLVEDYAYTACVPGTMRWKGTAFDVVEIGGASYAAALFTFDADGVAT